jgi:putative hemin transport protein
MSQALPLNENRLSGVALRRAWRTLQEGPRLRARDAAERLRISEGELIASECGPGGIARRLVSDVEAILRACTALGPVMALTRNDHVVHEKIGVYDKLSFSGAMGMVLNHDIDLRIFLSHWRHAFGLVETLDSGATRRSLQFFDLDGTAVHKIFEKEKTDAAAFDALLDRFAAPGQTPVLDVMPRPKAKPEFPDHEIDVTGLRAHWAAMQDTHEFFGLLNAFGVGRHQALRLAGARFAVEIGRAATRTMLERAAEGGVPIMCFTGNPGCIQIHSGPVETVKVMGPWLNVLDPGFNLHLREDRIASTWLVRKPTRDGIVTSIELFDTANVNFTMFFGERKPGKPERDEWRTLAESLADGATA